MTQISYTAIDFDVLKQELINYISSQSEFTDYNVEGANMSLLLDLLAYITNILSYNLNQGINENYLDTAELRSNILKIIKTLNYVPSRSTSSKIYADLSGIEISSEIGATTQNLLTYDKISGGGYDFYYVGSPVEIQTATGGYENISSKLFYEGLLVELTSVFTGDNTDFQEYIIEDTVVGEYLKVYTYDSVTDTRTYWEQFDEGAIYSDPGNAYIYFIEEQEIGYRIYFGNNSLGRRPILNERIDFEYIRPTGIAANSIDTFTWTGGGTDAELWKNYTNDYITAATVAINSSGGQSISYGGDEKETIAEIKFNAPKFWQTQGRAVTASDYTALALTNSLVDKAISVGGQDVTPTQLGKVFVTVKPDEDVVGSNLFSTTQLTELKTELELKSVVSIDVVTQNPQYIYLLPTTVLRYTGTQAPSLSATSSAVDIFINTSNSDFGEYLEFSKLVATIDDADTITTSNITSMEMYSLIKETHVENEDVNGTKIEDGDYLITLGKNLDTTYTTKILKYDDQTGSPTQLDEGVDYTITYIDDNTGDDGLSGQVRISFINTGDDLGIVDTGNASNTYRLYFKTDDDDIFLNNGQIFYLDPTTYLQRITTESV